MKIYQAKKPFNPIIITLETEEDAEALWLLMRITPNPNLNSDVPPDVERAYEMAVEISDWFSNGGKL